MLVAAAVYWLLFVYEVPLPYAGDWGGNGLPSGRHTLEALGLVFVLTVLLPATRSALARRRPGSRPPQPVAHRDALWFVGGLVVTLLVLGVCGYLFFRTGQDLIVETPIPG